MPVLDLSNILHLVLVRAELLEHCLHRPHKSQRRTPVLARRCQKLDEGHESIARHRCQHVPPAMKLQEESQRHADTVLPGRQRRTEINIEVPEEIGEQCVAYSSNTESAYAQHKASWKSLLMLTSCKSDQRGQLLSVKRRFRPTLDQFARLPSNGE